ncbi:gp88 [Alphaproteobacteria phage PhiJL001]|uniref:Gp88 n=1 Tax=Alphaproteobacteria phage PhiJL001 TaxID=2681607 RepID=Q5DN17_9CAUD|nr:virion structural protein [Alphaproteobacteria phage PhiJL001]AAT69481.1 gp88 [Alphaproteobacteria phage PhiJL001]
MLQNLFLGTVSAAALSASAGNQFVSVASWTGTNESGSWTGFTGRIVIQPGALGFQSASQIKLTFTSHSTQGMIVTSCYIAHGSLTGNAYDFVETPTQVRFDGGNANFAIGAASSIVSDVIDFEYNGTSPLVVSFWCDTGNGAQDSFTSLEVANWECYFLAGDNAATVAPAGVWSTTTLSGVGITNVEMVQTGDPLFGEVVFLSNFEDADLSTPEFLDESEQRNANTWPSIDTAVASISTTQSRFDNAAYKNLSSGISGNTHATQIDEAVPTLFPESGEDFTWEGWAYIDGSTVRSGQGDFFGSFGTSGNRGYILAFNEDELRVLYATSGSAFSTLTYATTFQGNIWYHIAFVKEGLDMEVFLDGVSLGTQTMSAWHRPSTRSIEFGSHESGNGNGLGGYLDDWRFTKGIARYTAGFTPPTTLYPRAQAADPIFSEVALLMGFDFGLVDESDFARDVERFGGAARTSVTTLNGTGSLLLDGDGDYLEFDHATELSAANAVDKTYECFIRVDSLAQINTIFCKRNTTVSGTDGEFLLLLETDGTLGFFTFDTMSTADVAIEPTDVLAVDTVYHIAVTREGTTWRMFLDGVQIGTDTETATPGANSGPLWIGRERTHPGREFTGRIDEVRITHGTARYTANFAPPIGKFPRNATKDANITSVALLLGFDAQVDTDTAVTDESPNRATVTFNGASAQVDDAQSRFGGKSLVLGSDAYISVPDSSKFGVDNSNDKTYECWIRTTSLAATQSIFNKRDASAAEEFRLIVPTSGLLRLDTYDGSTEDVSITGTTVMAVDTWYHVAATRQGGVWRIFVDGNLEASGTEAATPAGNTGDLRIGSSAFNSSRFFVGNIDEIRITDGVARYTANFTAPTQKFPRT